MQLVAAFAFYFFTDIDCTLFSLCNFYTQLVAAFAFYFFTDMTWTLFELSKTLACET